MKSKLSSPPPPELSNRALEAHLSDNKLAPTPKSSEPVHRDEEGYLIDPRRRTLVGRPLSSLERFSGNDPDELIRSRFLCRKGGALLCGPTGIGKSSLGMQLSIQWALGSAIFGIQPKRPLTSLLVQAENDDGDLAEMRDGVIRGLKLRREDAKRACNNVTVLREDEHTGMAFCNEVLRPLLIEHKPDLLWIDPALSYLGGDMNSQKDVGGFLRNGLNPLLREFNCGCVVVHHVNKPTGGNAKPDWSANDFAYLGAGSAEWANWARAVLALRTIRSQTVFQLQAGKRGSRLGWKNENGERLLFKHLAHSKESGAIYWREAEPGEVEDAQAESKPGRRKEYDDADVLGLLPVEGLTTGEWENRAVKELGISKSHFANLKKPLVESRRVEKREKRWIVFVEP
jgi:hypothetical protein